MTEKREPAESTQPTASDDNIFSINNLIDITKKEDETFKKFIDHHLFPQKSQLEIEDINNNIDILQKLNGTQQALVKGRAKSFEELNDPSKYFPSLIAIFGLVIGLYALLREISEGASWVYILSVLVGAGLTIFVARLFGKTVKRRATAVFFNTLLNSIDFKK
jgi:hypothetical protein